MEGNEIVRKYVEDSAKEFDEIYAKKSHILK